MSDQGWVVGQVSMGAVSPGMSDRLAAQVQRQDAADRRAAAEEERAREVHREVLHQRALAAFQADAAGGARMSARSIWRLAAAGAPTPS